MIAPVLNAFGNALSGVFGFVPHLFGFLALLFVGWLVASGCSRAMMGLLHRVGIDRLSNRLGFTNLERRMGMRMDGAHLLGKIVFWFVFLIFLLPAADSLGLPAVSNTLNTLVG